MKAKMTMLKLKVSTKMSYNSDRWQHQDIDTTPYLDYEFNKGTNWKANDTRLADRTAVARFKNTYWEQRTLDPSQPKYHYFGKNKTRRIPNGHRQTTNLSLYQDELEREVQKAIAKVNRHWEKKYKEDFEYHFQEPLTKFLTKKETAE